MVMLNINIGKKETIFFMAFFVMIIGFGGVIAFNSEGPPSVMGHSAEEIIMPEHSHLDFESGRVT
jgi:hypothetical protein